MEEVLAARVPEVVGLTFAGRRSSMGTSRDSAESIVLGTGWRVRGELAEQFRELATTESGTRFALAPGDPRQSLYALTGCTFETQNAGRPMVEELLDLIGEEVRVTDPECPRLTRDQPLERPVSRFAGLRFDIDHEPGSFWIGELIWRSVLPSIPGAPVTRRVIIEESPDFVRLSLRVTADEGLATVRNYVGAGQAQPHFLRRVRDVATPSWLGGPLRATTVSHPEDVADLLALLEHPGRDYPVAVLSPLEDGTYLVDPEDLAWELLGRARLYVLSDHSLTFELTDAVGDRRMSCYWGAARAYLPGWSPYADPLEHPLLLGDQVEDPHLRARWLGEVGLWLARRAQLPDGVEERRMERQAAESTAGDASSSPSKELTSAQTVREVPSDGYERTGTLDVVEHQPEPDGERADIGRPELRALEVPVVPMHPVLELVGDVSDDVHRLAEVAQRLGDEVERLRMISEIRASSTAAIERRLRRLEGILEEAFPDETAFGEAHEEKAESEDADAEDRPITLVEVVREAAEAYADALLILDSAIESAADSPYEDPERVRPILEAMARIARKRRDGQLKTSLKEAFKDYGIDYRGGIARSTSAKLREQYRFLRPDGVPVQCEEHIALGDTYDPRRCLRVYFSSRIPDDPRFVIGHVGRHFKVKSTT